MSEVTGGLSRKQAKVNRLEAVASGAKTFTGVTCPQGHDVRLTSNGNCVACQRFAVLRWAKENPDKQRERSRRFFAKNANAERERNREWYQANIDAQRERGREKRARDPKKALADYRIWAASNPDKVRANDSARRHGKIYRTPPWLTPEHRERMAEIYAEAAWLTRTTGQPHEVDHIVPLRGKQVSGLHVPWNLQVLSRAENQTKAARFNGGW